jgi:hypothetical protein
MSVLNEARTRMKKKTLQSGQKRAVCMDGEKSKKLPTYS